MLRKLSCLCVFATGCAATAGENGNPNWYMRLPNGLKDFAMMTEAHEELVADETVDSIVEADADYDVLLDVFKPNEVHRLERGFQVMGNIEGWKLVAASDVVLESGTVLAPGNELAVGDRVKSGAVFNAGRSGIHVRTEEAAVVLGGAGTHVNALLIDPGQALLAACLSECSTGCGDGAFACCSGAGGCAKCGCLTNGSSAAVCDAGGTNATACSVVARANNLENKEKNSLGD